MVNSIVGRHYDERMYRFYFKTKLNVKKNKQKIKYIISNLPILYLNIFNNISPSVLLLCF
jgi:hypothetical protein